MMKRRNSLALYRNCIRPSLQAMVVFVLMTGAFLPDRVSHAVTAPVCESDRYPIWITIDKVRSSKGTIKVELYSGKDSESKKGNKVARTRVKALAGETSLCLNAPEPGEYSIAFYHDENGNGKFDQNFIGIPKEGFGFSTNPHIGFSRPSHKEIKFRVGNTTTRLRISAIYM